MRPIAIVLVSAAMLAGQTVWAADRLKLDQTNIFGNRELPKVTFVTPWRDIAIEMPNSRFSLDNHEPLLPLDRETLLLEIEMKKQLRKQGPSGKGAQ